MPYTFPTMHETDVYHAGIKGAAWKIMDDDIEAETTLDSAVTDAADQEATGYANADDALLVLKISKNSDAYATEHGIEGDDIISCLVSAAFYAIKADIWDELGGDFEEYRVKCDEHFGRDSFQDEEGESA